MALFVGHPWDDEAERQTPKEPEDKRRARRADAAAILVEDFIQPVVERAFNRPISPLERGQLRCR